MQKNMLNRCCLNPCGVIMDTSDEQDMQKSTEINTLLHTTQNPAFKEDDVSNDGCVKNRLKLLRNDNEYRITFTYSLCVTWMVFVQGWIKGQIGPAFPDILHITHTDLEKGSAYLTAFYAGKVFGSATGGFVFDRCNTNIYISAVYFLHALSMAAIPWSVTFEAMIAVFCCTGFLSSWMDVAGITCSMRMFGKEGHVYVQLNQLAMSISSILSPLVTAPFLLSTKSSVHTKNTSFTVAFENTTNYLLYGTSTSAMSNSSSNGIPMPNKTSPMHDKSMIFIPFLIAVGLILTSSLTFFVMELFGKRNILSTPEENTNRTNQTSSKLLYIICLINICLFGGYCSALEVSMGNLLPMFCIKQLSWEPAKGAFAISIYFLTYTFSRAFGTVLSKFIEPIKMIVIYTVTTILVFSVFLLCAYEYWSIGVWVSVALCGFAVSGLYPALLTSLNQLLSHVSGKLISLFLVTSYVGSLAEPLFLGFLMEKFDAMWFAYLNIIVCLLLFISLIFLMFCKKSLNQ